MAQDAPLGDDKLPVELDAEGGNHGPHKGGVDSQADYAVERVEQVYR